MIQKGQFIQSTSLLVGTIFEDSKILICDVNEKGAWGFIMNKPFPRKLNELVEFNHCPAFPLWNGGPVENEKLFFIHQRPDLIEDGTHIFDNYYWSGNFQQAIQHIIANTINEHELKLFIGYCGWDDTQLQEEIKEGSWEIVDFS